MFHRRDHHPAPVFGLLRGTSQVLPVHGDRRMCRAVLAGPLTDGVVQGLGRQRGEDVVEGGDCGRGVALLARAPERTHCLDLLLGEQGGELGERVHTSVAGQTGSDGDRQNGVQRVALAPVTAALGTSPRHSNRLRSRGAAIGSVCCSAFQCAGTRSGSAPGGFRSVRTEDLLGLAVVAPARRSGLAGKAAGQPQRAPVRRAVAGPDKARTSTNVSARKTGYPCTAWMSCDSRRRLSPSTREAHPARRQDDKARVVGDQMQAPN